MFGKLNPTTSTKNIFGGTSSKPSSGTNPFGGSQKPNNPFGGQNSGNSTVNNNSQPSYSLPMMNPGVVEGSNIMYLSSNNPNRHSKLSTFQDNIKRGFYFIENIFENNERYMDAFRKLYSHEDMAELKETSNEAVKSVKSAWTSLNSVNNQLKILQGELEKNKNVSDQIALALKNLKNGEEDVEIPSSYFQDLITQFEARLSNYQKRIDEIEELINSSLEKESQKKSLLKKGSLNNDLEYEAQSDLSNTNLLYQVLQLLYDNFLTVANQVEAITEMVDSRVLKTKRFLERNSNMSLNEIDQLFEYKESESDTMINNLNSLSMRNNEKSTLSALSGLSLDDEDSSIGIGRKRRAYETSLISNEEGKHRSKYNE